MHCVFSRWLARAHHAVDGDTGGELVDGFVHAQGLRHVGTLVEFVGVDAMQLLHTGFAQFLEQGFCQLVIGTGDQLTGVAVDDVLGNHTADEEVFWHADVRGFAFFQFASVACCYALVFGNNDFAGFVSDVEAGNFTTQTLGDKFHLCAAVHQTEAVIHKEVGQNSFLCQTNRFEQNGDRHFAATVHAEIQEVFWIELEVEPRTAVRNDAGAEQQFARAVGLAFVVFEEYAR